MNLQHREQLQRFRLLSESTMASSTQSRLSQQEPSGSTSKSNQKRSQGQHVVQEQHPEETADDDNKLLMRKIIAACLDIHAGLVTKRQPSVASQRNSNASNRDTTRQSPPRINDPGRNSLQGSLDFVPNNIEDENDPFVMKVLAHRTRQHNNQSTNQIFTPGNNANKAPKILAERSRVLHNEDEPQLNAPRSIAHTADMLNSTTSILSESNHDIVIDATVKNVIIDEVTALNDLNRSSLIVNGTEDAEQGFRSPPREQRREQRNIPTTPSRNSGAGAASRTMPGAFAVAGPGFDTSPSTRDRNNAQLMRRPLNLTATTMDATSFVSSDTLASNRSNDIEPPKKAY